MIELQDITKIYADFTAVKNLNLTVRAGEVFGFIGPKGAGKTTTIKIIGGILKPTAGSARICGIDIGRQPEAAKKMIGFIPSTFPGFDPELPTYDYDLEKAKKLLAEAGYPNGFETMISIQPTKQVVEILCGGG